MTVPRPRDWAVYFGIGALIGCAIGIAGSIVLLEAGPVITVLIGLGAALVGGGLGVVLEDDVVELLQIFNV